MRPLVAKRNSIVRIIHRILLSIWPPSTQSTIIELVSTVMLVEYSERISNIKVSDLVWLHRKQFPFSQRFCKTLSMEKCNLVSISSESAVQTKICKRFTSHQTVNWVSKKIKSPFARCSFMTWQHKSTWNQHDEVYEDNIVMDGWLNRPLASFTSHHSQNILIDLN